MATKTLRLIRDSKHTGLFTREQIDRAIRIVENGDGSAGLVRKNGSVLPKPLQEHRSSGKK